MDLNGYLAVLATEATTLAAAAEEAGLDADVATCPGWSVADLVLHLGEVHRWATAAVASKATKLSEVTRVVRRRGKPVWEFGTRRAQGPQAGVRAARAAYVGGCAGTSNVLAGYLYGVPITGTAAHSSNQVFPTERESFEALLDTFPDTAILLIDTYDPLVGAQTARYSGSRNPGCASG